MSSSLLDLTKLAVHTQTVEQAAIDLGFGAAGDIDRFLFKSYGKTIREIPPANRPKGAIFFLAPAAGNSSLASPSNLKPVIQKIQSEVAKRFYQVPLDVAGAATVRHETSVNLQREMASGAWQLGTAQKISRTYRKCVVWANGVSATVFLNGDIYLESHDVVEELPNGLPTSFQALSWSEGEIVYEFAENELNDTSETGIWRLPDQHLLRPKPERLMSTGLSKFLQHRMAGYRHHEEEGHVANEGRSDISLTLYNGDIYIIEVKWIGQSLVGTKNLEPETAIKAALKAKTKGWVTQYDDTTFTAGARQLAKYFKTGKYKRAYLVAFDCCAPKAGRKHESPAIDPSDVAPYNSAEFRAHRACVDPRKASRSSKAKSP